MKTTDCIKCKGAPVQHDCDCDYCAGDDRDVPTLNDTITGEKQ